MAEKLETSVCEQVVLALSTLAGNTVLSADSPIMTRGGTLVSTTIAAAFRSADTKDGPLLWGVADKALSNAQVEGFLENQGPVSPSEPATSEIASRGNRIQPLGILQVHPAGVGEVPASFLRNEPIRLAFTEEGAGWRWWVYNMGATFVAGSDVQIVAKSFVKFRKSG